MLRILKIGLVAAVLAWAVVGIWDNLAAWQGTNAAIAAVTSMKTLPPGGPEGWRATTNTSVILAGVIFILMFKLATAGFCAAGAWRMWNRRSADADTFARAKVFALTGCSVAVLGLFTGWIVIAGEYFETFRAQHDASELAFCYGGFIGLIALLVSIRDE